MPKRTLAKEIEEKPVQAKTRRVRIMDEDSPIHETQVESTFPSETVVELEEEPEQVPATGKLPLTYESIQMPTNPVQFEPSKGRILTIEVSKTRQYEEFEPDRCTIVYELGVGEEEILEDVYFNLRQQVYDLLDMPLEDK